MTYFNYSTFCVWDVLTGDSDLPDDMDWSTVDWEQLKSFI